jgi:hypothetical protein
LGAVADTSRPTSTGPTTTAPSSQGDWPAQVTDTVVGLVDSAKEKVNGPATSAARGTVWGTFGAIVGTAALVLFLVVLFRGIDIVVEIVLDAAGVEKAGRSTWIAHTIFGLLFLVPGLVLLKRAARPPAAA